MPHVLHLVDATDPQELRLALNPLLSKLKGWEQSVCVTSGRRRLGGVINVPFIEHVPPRFGKQMLNAPRFRRLIAVQNVELIHAWSFETAFAVAVAGCAHVPLALSLWDPHITAQQARRLLALKQIKNLGLLCHSGVTRRRAVERGVDLERTVIVRPGIDFGAINRYRNKRDALREELNIAPEGIVVLLPDPPSVIGGHELGMLATAIAQRIMPELVLIIPGVSAQQSKLLRYAQRIPNPLPIVATGEGYPFEALLGVADLLLVPASGDVSATPLAWAMGASVPILGCATYSVTEFIADGHNGLLAKYGDPMALVGKMVRGLGEPEESRLRRDRARAEAFESFGRFRYIEQTRHAYDNLLATKPVSEGIVDAALDV